MRKSQAEVGEAEQLRAPAGVIPGTRTSCRRGNWSMYGWCFFPLS